MHMFSRTALALTLSMSVTPFTADAANRFTTVPLTIRPLNDRESADVSSSASALKVAGFDLTRIDGGLCDEFAKAWRVSRNGSTGEEGVVLVFRMVGGSYEGRSLGSTAERLKFTFKWVPNAIAIVHTHPNNRPPQPSSEDELVAIKYRVPIFTITANGMYVFDPLNKQTRKVMEGLDWLEPSKFTDLTLSKLSDESHASTEIQ